MNRSEQIIREIKEIYIVDFSFPATNIVSS